MKHLSHSVLLPKKILELHAVGLVTRLHSEHRAQVTSLLLAQGVLLDRSNQSRVDGLLQSSALLRDGALGGSLRRLLGLSLSGLLGLVTHELALRLHTLLGLGTLERVNGDLARVDGGNVDLGGGGDDVAGVHTADGDTVVLHGASDHQRAVLGQLLQDNSALATEAASEDDRNDTRGDALAGRRERLRLAVHLLGNLRVDLLGNLGGSGHVETVYNSQ
mmetsp:Transcript_11417/g.13084  ORF Transcript_11417/g.13084 Transcript_11417/m.13084 type:complete len:219 (-) Transcript_11417:12-668(-)